MWLIAPPGIPRVSVLQSFTFTELDPLHILMDAHVHVFLLWNQITMICIRKCLPDASFWYLVWLHVFITCNLITCLITCLYFQFSNSASCHFSKLFLDWWVFWQRISEYTNSEYLNDSTSSLSGGATQWDGSNVLLFCNWQVKYYICFTVNVILQTRGICSSEGQWIFFL